MQDAALAMIMPRGLRRGEFLPIDEGVLIQAGHAKARRTMTRIHVRARRKGGKRKLQEQQKRDKRANARSWDAKCVETLRHGRLLSPFKKARFGKTVGQGVALPLRQMAAVANHTLIGPQPEKRAPSGERVRMNVATRVSSQDVDGFLFSVDVPGSNPKEQAAMPKLFLEMFCMAFADQAR